jgi:Ca-activated chloride channel homolog
VNKKLLLACFSVLAVALLWSRQTTGQNKEFTIGVEVNMVNVPITLRNPKGDFLKGLPQSAFQIYEDGEEQEIELFSQEAVPARIAVVLDISGSVQGEWGSIKFATKKFLENLAKDDEFALITFNTEIRQKMNWGRKIDRVDAVLGSIYCKDDTKLWDAIWLVSNDVFKGIKEKKAMIIMSDGLDNRSSESYESALQAAVRSEATIYVVSKTEAVRRLMEANAAAQNYYQNIPYAAFSQADSDLKHLAYETGGRVLYPSSFGELGNVYAQVDEELKNQYSIGYVSTNALKDGSYRNIKVVVKAPGAQISARPGYYAPDELHKKGTK